MNSDGNTYPPKQWPDSYWAVVRAVGMERRPWCAGWMEGGMAEVNDRVAVEV